MLLLVGALQGDNTALLLHFGADRIWAEVETIHGWMSYISLTGTEEWKSRGLVEDETADTYEAGTEKRV